MVDNPHPSAGEIQVAIELVPAPVIVSDGESRTIIAMNQSAADEFRLDPAVVIGTLVDKLTHVEFRAELDANYVRSAAAGGFVTLKRYVRGDGTSFMGQLRAAPTPGHPGLLTAVVTNVEDTDAMRAETVAAATIDELTGALRRNAFLDAARLLASMHPHYAVLFIDVDGLKAANDEHGHEAGDLMLSTTTSRIKEAFRHGDLVGRFGGDEFVVFVSDLPSAAEVARLTNAVEQRVGRPLKYGKLELPLRVSIGAAFCAKSFDLDDAIRAADQAMLVTKRRHRAGDLARLAIDDIVVLD